MRYQYISINRQTLIIIAISIFYFVLEPSALFAQQTKDPIDERIQNAFVNTIAIYDSEIGSNSMVNTGNSYFDSFTGIKGHQYFLNDYWEEGSVVYEGHFFDSIYLKYDINQDQLLIEHFNSDGYLSPIQLYRSKVSSFELMGYSFIWLKKDTISNLRTGYYNHVYKSRDLEILIKRKKLIVSTNEIGAIGEKFIESDKYYIKKDNLYYQVKKKNSIIKVFSDRKKEIKNFIKRNNFRFKINPDNQLVEVVAYYDSLF